MRDKWKIIRAGLGIIIFTVVGLWEYLQLYMSYDLPQAVVILPVTGLLAAILLRRLCFIVPAATAVMAVVYQLLEAGSVSEVKVSDDKIGLILGSVPRIIFNILPIVLVLLFVGIGGGFLVRVLVNGKKPRSVGVVCCVLGIVLTLGGSVALYRNPLYPFLARHALSRYAEKYDSDEYRVSRVVIHYSMENMEYEANVEMSDGITYVIYHDRATGKVYDLTDLS